MSKTVSMRWLVAVVAGVVVGMFALTETAVAPPAGAPVRIIDADDSSLAAHVDADGNLQVGGTVGIDPSTPVATTSLNTPGVLAFQDSVRLDILDGDEIGSATFLFPFTTRRLLITHVSGEVHLPTGQKVLSAGLQHLPSTGHPTQTFGQTFVPNFTGTRSFAGAPPEDYFVFSQDTFAFIDGGPLEFFRIEVLRDGFAGTGTGVVEVSGYQIDCQLVLCQPF